LATAALRGLLVVAALALGFFVLSKAFPSGDQASTVTPGGGAVTTPPPTVSPAISPTPGRQAPEPLPFDQIKVQVLNGTDVSGLAADTAELLEDAGYKVPTIGDAEVNYDVTTIFHVPKRKVDAQLLQEKYFPMAVLEVADEDIEVDITVNLGSDYAATLE
jgi:hypothetical protein